MVDPLSTSAAVIGIISFGITVTLEFIQFLDALKHQGQDIVKVTEALKGLSSTLRSLESYLKNRTFQVSEQSLLRDVERSIMASDTAIQKLNCELDRLRPTKGSKMKTAYRQISYQFQKNSLKLIKTEIYEALENLSLATTLLGLRGQQQLRLDGQELKAILERIGELKNQEKLHKWLRPPDATVDLNEAASLRQPGTGRWLVTHEKYKTWLYGENGHLWLYGSPGCGKTVLSSMVVQHVARSTSLDSSTGLAFFYFTFTDESKQTSNGMLASVLWQLSKQNNNAASALEDLNRRYETSNQSSEIKMASLRRIINCFDHVYLILDALDEIPHGEQRRRTLSFLKTMRTWIDTPLHILITCRDAYDIRQYLTYRSTDEEIHDFVLLPILASSNEEDILRYIASGLKNDLELRDFGEYQDIIQRALITGADGMFRWVECQLNALRRCPRSMHHVTRCLSSLPRTLEETYEKALCNISEVWEADIRRLLVFLCFASRPLTIEELIDGLAVGPSASPKFDPYRRLKDINDLRRMCPDLIAFSSASSDAADTAVSHTGENTSSDVSGGKTYVRLTHFSVREYLELDETALGKAKKFTLQKEQVHGELAKTCFNFLLDPDLARVTDARKHDHDHPFIQYAIRNWMYHFERTPSAAVVHKNELLQLFTSSQAFFEKTVSPVAQELVDQTVDDGRARWKSTTSRSSHGNINPVSVAVLLRLPDLLSNILEKFKAAGTSVDPLLNQLVAPWGLPLVRACSMGDESIVRILLQNGADPNVEDWKWQDRFGVLWLAMENGDHKIAKLLLEKGAYPNSNFLQDQYLEIGSMPRYTPLLVEACRRFDIKMIDMLLRAGADPNGVETFVLKCWATVERSDVESALYIACEGGNIESVKLLLSAGAKVNLPNVWQAKDTVHLNALEATHDPEIIHLLESAAER